MDAEGTEEDEAEEEDAEWTEPGRAEAEEEEVGVVVDMKEE